MAIWQTSRPTVICSEFWGMHSWIEGSNLSLSEGVEDLINTSSAVRSLPFHSSVYSAHESQKIFFLFFCSRPPFWVFTLESHFSFSFFFIFWLSYYALKNSSRTGEWFIKNFGWGKETTALLIKKISQGRLSSVWVSTFDQNELFRYVI